MLYSPCEKYRYVNNIAIQYPFEAIVDQANATIHNMYTGDKMCALLIYILTNNYASV